jgi:hypothetical protein
VLEWHLLACASLFVSASQNPPAWQQLESAAARWLWAKVPTCNLGNPASNAPFCKKE